jgi:hypothetical protein
LGGPPEADAVLIVDADRVLALAVALQGLKSIAGRREQILKYDGIVEHLKLSLDDPLDVSETPGGLALVDGLRLLGAEGTNHDG